MFLEMLNDQDPLKKYTVEFENYLLSFKDINIISNTTNKIWIKNASKGRNHKHAY